MLPNYHRSSGVFVLVSILYLAACPFCYAQNQPPAADATVKSDSLAVHSYTNETSDVVQTLKKGDALLLGLEVQTTAGSWCSVRLPGQTARLGYVRCDGLERKASAADSTSPSTRHEPGSATVIGGNSARPPVSLPLGRTEAESTSEYARIESTVVHNGTLDGPKIAEYEREAQSGSSAAMTHAALAHMAAGKFELAHGDSDPAIEQLRAALPFSAKQPVLRFGVLMLLAYIHLARSEYSTALDYLNQARTISPNSVSVAQLSGEAYYGLNRVDDAIKQWQAAQRIAPNPNVALWLERAGRDQAAEAGASERETSHFVLRYQGNATPQLAADVLRTLEEHFNSLRSTLDFTPVDPIGVVLYTQQSFRDITLAPTWASGYYDGRIRVPVEGLTSVTPELSRVLKHELTHSFVFQMSLGRCPTWLNEGLAQWMEGKRSAGSAKFLILAYDQKQYVPLERLSGPWNSFPAPLAGYAYAWGLAATEFLISRSGPWGISRLFANFNSSTSFETAMGAALQINYVDLERGTVNYLRQTYGN